MTQTMETLVDYITGREIPDTGAEANRQALEHFLVDEKGYDRDDIQVDVPITLDVAGETYRSKVDLVICLNAKCFMAVKCAAGSLGSREREIVAAARLLTGYQIPFAMVSDGETAILLDTLTGKKIGEGLDIIPSREEAFRQAGSCVLEPLSEERQAKEKLIFRSYDSMNVNRSL